MGCRLVNMQIQSLRTWKNPRALDLWHDRTNIRGILYCIKCCEKDGAIILIRGNLISSQRNQACMYEMGQRKTYVQALEHLMKEQLTGYIERTMDCVRPNLAIPTEYAVFGHVRLWQECRSPEMQSRRDKRHRNIELFGHNRDDNFFLSLWVWT